MCVCMCVWGALYIEESFVLRFYYFGPQITLDDCLFAVSANKTHFCLITLHRK